MEWSGEIETVIARETLFLDTYVCRAIPQPHRLLEAAVLTRSKHGAVGWSVVLTKVQVYRFVSYIFILVNNRESRFDECSPSQCRRVCLGVAKGCRN